MLTASYAQVFGDSIFVFARIQFIDVAMTIAYLKALLIMTNFREIII
jgi:hypothetical protein